ncbi:hypothetical protein E4T49_02801 [Aureobasidium sp. EXF-10728]|nr:hypothetical protein E4T49_02801 [Aureobasidium sp. EXF-10728]
MYSRKITYLWALLAIGVTITSGLPTPQLDNDDLDCGSWEDEADVNQSASITSTASTHTPTALVAQASFTSYPSPATLVTSASPTGNPSSTNPFFAPPTNSFVPVTPPSYAFYLQSSSSGSSNGFYATVSAGTDGLTTFTANKDVATKFTIDSSGDLVEQSPSQGYVGTLNPEVDSQKLEFKVYDGANSYGRLNCQRQSGGLSCNVGGVEYTAATCGSDGALYFTKTVTAGCTGINLVPVFS